MQRNGEASVGVARTAGRHRAAAARKHLLPTGTTAQAPTQTAPQGRLLTHRRKGLPAIRSVCRGDQRATTRTISSTLFE
jgi:hypothetical protein